MLLLQDIPVWLIATTLVLVCFLPHFLNILIMSRPANCTDMTIITGSDLHTQYFVNVWQGTIK